MNGLHINFHIHDVGHIRTKTDKCIGQPAHSVVSIPVSLGGYGGVDLYFNTPEDMEEVARQMLIEARALREKQCEEEEANHA